MSDLYNAISISAHGMRAQGSRIRVISENMANASTTANTPDEDPYTRKTVTFENELNRKSGLSFVTVKEVNQERPQSFDLKFMPDHPGADENGYVKVPNVNPLIEAMDMREAQRTYEANLGMIEQSRNMAMQTIDLLRQ